MPVLKSSVTHFLHNIILLWDSSKGEKESERKIPVAIVIILTNSDLKLIKTKYYIIKAHKLKHILSSSEIKRVSTNIPS